MADLQISTGTTEYLCEPVEIFGDDGTPVDLTGMVVEVALPAAGVAPVDWHTGSWGTHTAGPISQRGSDGVWRTFEAPVFLARVLVGPEAVALTAGESLDMWVRVTTGGPEIVARNVGRVQVTV